MPAKSSLKLMSHEGGAIAIGNRSISLQMVQGEGRKTSLLLVLRQTLRLFFSLNDLNKGQNGFPPQVVNGAGGSAR